MKCGELVHVEQYLMDVFIGDYDISSRPFLVLFNIGIYYYLLIPFNYNAHRPKTFSICEKEICR